MGSRLGHRSTDQIATLMEAARVFAGITAESVAQTDTAFTLPQLRVLVLASENPSLSVSAVAKALDVHMSGASRLCDRLVRMGMLDRRDRPDDRRQLELTLTPEGRRQLELVEEHRRQVFAIILRRIPVDQRRELQSALQVLITAADEYAAARTHVP